MKIFDWTVQVMGIALALAAAPVFLGWVNQCRAWLQNKSAPSILQPYRGIRKLFHKDAVIAQNASQLFRLAPYVVFGAMVTAAAVILTVVPFVLGERASAQSRSDRAVVDGRCKEVKGTWLDPNPSVRFAGR